MTPETILVTGATGMIGAPIVRRAASQGHEVLAVVRASSDRTVIEGANVQFIESDLTRPNDELRAAVERSNVVVHTAAQVGDWGPVDDYRAINLDAVKSLLEAAKGSPHLRRFVHLSALGVYEAKHHYGTDETTPPDRLGFDGYTNTKAQAEDLVQAFHHDHSMPTVIVRPGFTYGAGDRRILPRLIEAFENGTARMIGDGQRVLNNTNIDNLIDGIFLTLEKDEAIGEIFNIRDERLVTREEFLNAVADYLNKPPPGRVPEWFARAVRPAMEGWARWRRWQHPPLLTGATMKFLTLNLDFSIDKAKRLLGYQPRVDFKDGIQDALAWAMEQREQTTVNQ